MTSNALQCTPYTDASVEAALAPAHLQWLDQVRHFVGPSIGSVAGVWDRWSAMRFLGDRFPQHFVLERRFLASIAPRLDSVAAARLAGQATHIEKLRARIDRVGRQHGTRAVAVEDLAELVRSAWVWCVELEAAVGGIRRDTLLPPAAGLLARLIGSSGQGS